MICLYKKPFLRDLAKVPKRHRTQIESPVFEEIPELENVFATLDIKKIKGYQSYYRIRVGDYRIGCKTEEGKQAGRRLALHCESMSPSHLFAGPDPAGRSNVGIVTFGRHLTSPGYASTIWGRLRSATQDSPSSQQIPSLPALLRPQRLRWMSRL